MSFDQLAETIAGAILDAFEPVLVALQDDAGMHVLLDELGWSPPESAVEVSSLGPLLDLAKALGEAGHLLEQYRSTGSTDPATLRLLTSAIGDLGSALAGLQAPTGSTLPDPWGSPEVWSTLGEDIAALLVRHYLQRQTPSLFAALVLTGVLEEVVPDTRISPEISRGAYWRLHWPLIAQWLSDPKRAAAEAYGWGGNVKDLAIVRSAALAGQAFGLPVGIVDVGPPDDAGIDRPPRLVARLPLYTDAISGGDADTDLTAAVEVGVQLLPVPADPATEGPPTGFLIGPYAAGTAQADFQISPSVRVAVSGSAGVGINADLGIAVFPDHVRLVGEPSALAGGVGLTLGYLPETPLVIFGDPASTGLTLAGANLGFGVQGSITEPEVIIMLELSGLHLGFQLADGDSFLGSLTGNNSTGATVDIRISWSSKTGLTLNASGGLSATIPLNIAFGPLELIVATASARPHGNALELELAVSANATLGPFAASIDQVGVRLALQPSSETNKPAFAGVAISVGFKPPSGVGLAIDTPAVRGGGFLLIDPDAGQYAGVFELTIVGTVSVKAIAIISTKLPDGQPGFALLILITAEGFTPIQLGLGFSLTGIGGLLALNRTFNVDAVRNGLRDGVLDSILFVKDPIKNAPRIISTLNQVFPIASGRLVIGPLAEISWGVGPLVKIRLALLIDIPQPVKVVLLAQLRMVLPDQKNPVVELNVDAVGVLDFGRGELALDASIHHSRLLKFALSGDMAVRLNWGKEPSFLMAVGGFHPKYPPPPGLRPLERLTLALSDSENPRIRFETYLALTSNTIQMGARVSVYATAAGFGVDGGGSFDALIQWAPFSVDVSFQAWVRVFGQLTGTLAAIRLALEVTGPDPWHVSGVAELTLLFVSVQVGVDFRIGEGDGERTPVESFDVAAQIWAELSQPGSWQPVLPPGVRPGATLADPISPSQGRASSMVVHPLATITGRQRVAPLDRPITRVGAARPAAGVRDYRLTVTVADGVRVDPAQDLFAPAQYTDLPDDGKLTGPAFAPMQAGAVIAGAVAARHPEHGIASSDLTLETLEITTLEADPVASGPIPPISPNGQLPNELRDVARFAGAQAGLIS